MRIFVVINIINLDFNFVGIDFFFMEVNFNILLILILFKFFLKFLKDVLGFYNNLEVEVSFDINNNFFILLILDFKVIF